MFKNMMEFVKGEKVNVEEEMERDITIETSVNNEEKIVQNLKSKIQAHGSELNSRNMANNIYDNNELFTNRSNQVKIVKPKSFDNVEIIGEAIRDGKVIILDLNKLETQLATRILDFVNGVCFAHNIEPEKVEAKIFMIDPQHKRKR